MSHTDAIEHIGTAIEVAGVLLIVVGLLRAGWRSWRRHGTGLVRFDLEVVNQREEVVGGGSLRMLMRSRPPDP